MSLSHWTLLAQTTPQDLLKPSRPQVTNDVVLVFAAVALLVILFLGWAIFIRKRKKDLADWRLHRHHSHHSSDVNSPTESASDNEPHHHRRRRRRRSHRPRNPTLAETGGLPPVRSEPPSQPTI